MQGDLIISNCTFNEVNSIMFLFNDDANAPITNNGRVYLLNNTFKMTTLNLSPGLITFFVPNTGIGTVPPRIEVSVQNNAFHFDATATANAILWDNASTDAVNSTTRVFLSNSFNIQQNVSAFWISSTSGLTIASNGNVSEFGANPLNITLVPWIID
jgi:hypothetical protein